MVADMATSGRHCRPAGAYNREVTSLIDPVGATGAVPRVGHINFLNSLPFLVGLDALQTPPPFELRFNPPSELNRLLLAGALDVSPISSIAYAAHADELVLLPG